MRKGNFYLLETDMTNKLVKNAFGSLIDTKTALAKCKPPAAKPAVKPATRPEPEPNTKWKDKHTIAGIGTVTLKSDIPYPAGYRSTATSKYAELFAAWQIGQCVICESDKAAESIGTALSTHIRKRQLQGRAAAVKRHPATGKAHVYWLDEPRATHTKQAKAK